MRKSLAVSIAPLFVLMLFIVASGCFFVELGYVLLFIYTLYKSIFYSINRRFGVSTHYVALGIYCTLAAAFQIHEKMEFWGVTIPSENSFLLTLAICCLYNFGFEVGGIFRESFYKDSFCDRNSDKYRFLLDESFTFYAYFLITLGIAVLVVLSKPGLNLELRGGQEIGGDRAATIFLFSYLPKTYIWASLSVASVLFLNKKTVVNFLFVFMCLVCVLAFAGPSTTSRQIIVVGGMPAFFYFSYRFFPAIVSIGMWFAVVVVGPIINSFSRDQMYGVVTQAFPYSQDFDAIFITSAILERAEYFKIGLGRYLISAFSFFLPGEYKPFSDFDPLQGYGGTIFSQTNVSLPPFVPAYLDFSFPGVLLFGFFVGWFLVFLENKYMKSIALGGGVEFLLAFSLIAAYLPFVRGPILGWGPFFISGVVAFGSFSLAVKFFNKNKWWRD